VDSGCEAIAKHRQAAFRFGFSRLALQDIAVFGKAVVLDPEMSQAYPSDMPGRCSSE
jgi:hypothetical protein